MCISVTRHRRAIHCNLSQIRASHSIYHIQWHAHVYHYADQHIYVYVIVPIQCQIYFLKLYSLKDIHSNNIHIFFPQLRNMSTFLRNGRLVNLYLFLAKSIDNIDAQILRDSDYDLNSRGKYKCQCVPRKDKLWWESTNSKGY